MTNKDKQTAFEVECLECLRSKLFTKGVSALYPDTYRCPLYKGCAPNDEFRRRNYYGVERYHNAFDDKGDYGPAYDLERLISSAVPQSNGTVFPDFISDTGGFIECFCVTASKDSNKGSADKIAEAKVDKLFKEFEDSINEMPPPQLTTRELAVECQVPSASHEWLLQSFKKHWNHHVDSMRRSGLDSVYPKVFMVYADAPSLYRCQEAIATPNGNTMYCGLISDEEFRKAPYSVVHDRALLEWLVGNNAGVDFLIYISSPNQIDIIQLNNIPLFLDRVPSYTVYSLSGNHPVHPEPKDITSEI